MRIQGTECSQKRESPEQAGEIVNSPYSYLAAEKRGAYLDSNDLGERQGNLIDVLLLVSCL